MYLSLRALSLEILVKMMMVISNTRVTYFWRQSIFFLCKQELKLSQYL